MLFRARLEARAPSGRIDRVYDIEVERDLLGDLVVTIAYGRRGSVGTRLRLFASDVPTARRLVADRLRRRQTAPRRIGVPYRVVSAIATGELTARDWLAPYGEEA